MKSPTFRPDLTHYEVYIAAAVDLLNADAVFKISKTDFVKIAVEKALKTLLPAVRVKPKRKRYEKLNF
jgi:hypothetical protein